MMLYRRTCRAFYSSAADLSHPKLASAGQSSVSFRQCRCPVPTDPDSSSSWDNTRCATLSPFPSYLLLRYWTRTRAVQGLFPIRLASLRPRVLSFRSSVRGSTLSRTMNRSTRLARIRVQCTRMALRCLLPSLLPRSRTPSSTADRYRPSCTPQLGSDRNVTEENSRDHSNTGGTLKNFQYATMRLRRIPSPLSPILQQLYFLDHRHAGDSSLSNE